MSFANPIGLLGLLSLPAILALHLLRERSRTYPVSSLSLWSFLENEVRGTRPRRIPLTWLLAVDLLIAALLSLALAQPRLELPGVAGSGRHVVVLLDVSTSMRARDALPSRFSLAQREALALLAGLGPRDVATVLSFGASPRWIGDTRQVPLQDLLGRVAALQPGETGHDLHSALVSASAALAEGLPAEFHIFTDAAFPEPQLGEFTHPIRWRLAGQRSVNQAVLDVSATALAGDRFQVFTHLANYAELPASRVVTLLVDDNPVDSAIVDLAPGSVLSHVWEINGTASVVSVLLHGSDDLPQDDVASFGLHHGRPVRVALVTDTPEPLERALRAIPAVDLRVLSPQEYWPGMPFDLFFFRGVLPEDWPAGTVVISEPPTGSELLAVRGLEPVRGPAQPAGDPLLANVDFSGVRWARVWALDGLPAGFTPLLQAGQLPLLARGQSGPSQVYLLLPELDGGNLARHPAFPVLLANLVQSAGQAALPAQLYTGVPLPLPDAADYPHLRLISPIDELVELGALRPESWEQTREPGIYQLELVDQDGGLHRYALGVNAGSPAEADISPGAWAANQQAASAALQVEASRVVDLLPWLLAAAILFLFLEARLAWR